MMVVIKKLKKMIVFLEFLLNFVNLRIQGSDIYSLVMDVIFYVWGEESLFEVFFVVIVGVESIEGVKGRRFGVGEQQLMLQEFTVGVMEILVLGVEIGDYRGYIYWEICRKGFGVFVIYGRV